MGIKRYGNHSRRHSFVEGRKTVDGENHERRLYRNAKKRYSPNFNSKTRLRTCVLPPL